MTLWTTAGQAPLSMGVSRQGNWSGLACPPSGDLLDPGIQPVFLMYSAFPGRSFTTSATWELQNPHQKKKKKKGIKKHTAILSGDLRICAGRR